MSATGTRFGLDSWSPCKFVTVWGLNGRKSLGRGQVEGTVGVGVILRITCSEDVKKGRPGKQAWSWRPAQCLTDILWSLWKCGWRVGNVCSVCSNRYLVGAPLPKRLSVAPCVPLVHLDNPLGVERRIPPTLLAMPLGHPKFPRRDRQQLCLLSLREVQTSRLLSSDNCASCDIVLRQCKAIKQLVPGTDSSCPFG